MDAIHVLINIMRVNYVAMENKKEIVLDILNKISDLQFQNDVWTKQLYWDRILNYGEAINTLEDYSFFDDVNNGVIELNEKEEQRLLILFSKKVMEFDEFAEQKPIATNLKWREITQMAKILHEALLRANFG